MRPFNSIFSHRKLEKPPTPASPDANYHTTKKSLVEFHLFRCAPEAGKHTSYLLEGPGGRFYHIPAVGARAISLLRQHKSIGEAEKKVEPMGGGKYDVAAFVRFLAREGFVKTIDGNPVHPVHETGTAAYAFHDKLLVPVWLARSLFSPTMFIAYVLAVAGAAVLLISGNVQIIFSDFFFTDSLILYAIVSFAITWALVLMHEFGHYTAGVSVGIRPTFGLTHKLNYIVAYTDSTELYRVEPKQRFLPYLAGMFVDLLVLALCVWALFCIGAWKLDGLAMIAPLLTFVMLMEFFSLIWQTLIFLQTDLYYVIENFLGIEYLHKHSISYATEIGNWAIGRHKKPSGNHWGIYLAYALLLVAGTIFNLAIFAEVEYDILMALVSKTQEALTSTSIIHAADAIFLLVFLALNLYLILGSLIPSSSRSDQS